MRGASPDDGHLTERRTSEREQDSADLSAGPARHKGRGRARIVFFAGAPHLVAFRDTVSDTCECLVHTVRAATSP